MKKIMISSLMLIGALSTTAFAQNQCMIKFTLNRQSPTLVDFKYRMNEEIADALIYPLELGESRYVEVPCNQNYEIFATPVSKGGELATRSSATALGRCSYIL